MDRVAVWAPRVLSLLRIMTGLLFFEHGSSKILGFPPFGPGGSPLIQPPILSVLGVSGVLEFFGGGLIVLGLFTRPVAFLLSGEMAVGYFMAHAPRGFFPMANMGEPAILFTFVFLYFAFAGGGEWSLDSLLARRRIAVVAG
jgi:putative oxidoreductase